MRSPEVPEDSPVVIEPQDSCRTTGFVSRFDRRGERVSERARENGVGTLTSHGGVSGHYFRVPPRTPWAPALDHGYSAGAVNVCVGGTAMTNGGQACPVY